MRGALEAIGAWSPADGDVPGADAERALFHANLERKVWNAGGHPIAVMQRSPYVWPSGQSSRTVGPAGDLVGVKPGRVLYAKVMPVGSTIETPVRVRTHQQFADIPNKAQTGDVFSDLEYEDTGATEGTLTVWPVPTSAPTLVLHHQGRYTAFELGDELLIPEHGEPALLITTAKRLATVFGKPWTRELQDTYDRDFGAWQRGNIRTPAEVRMPRGIPGGRRNLSVSEADFNGGRF